MLLDATVNQFSSSETSLNCYKLVYYYLHGVYISSCLLLSHLPVIRIPPAYTNIRQPEKVKDDMDDMSTMMSDQSQAKLASVLSTQLPLLCQHACSHLTGHCWDKGCSTTAPLLWLDEGDLAVRCEVPNNFVEPVTETSKKKAVCLLYRTSQCILFFFF